MSTSVFDLFKIGIGPSSSHTVGPMKAALRFAWSLARHDSPAERVQVELLGSLGATGPGHATDRAIILGLSGHRPETIDPEEIPGLVTRCREHHTLSLPDGRVIGFDPDRDLIFDGVRTLPQYPNAMVFTAFDENADVLLSEAYFSVGGGLVLSLAEVEAEGKSGDSRLDAAGPALPFPFSSAAKLQAHCDQEGGAISDLVLANELARGKTEAEVRSGIQQIWEVMRESVSRGIHTDGMLPGPLNLHRRAPDLYRKLKDGGDADEDGRDPLAGLDWVDLYALAVGEENACGGRVVTAPTNGAAGTIPAVLHYCEYILKDLDEERLARFFLTATAVGSLYKENASLSAAEVGCQGEIGVACSMAAAALAEYMGATPAQAQNAAEIAMEHNLGLTCDPIAGLVQIPCIERNAMGAVKAINAARMALRRDRPQFVSLDQVIQTMRDTGRDMNSKYRETSRGGLAVNVPEC